MEKDVFDKARRYQDEIDRIETILRKLEGLKMSMGLFNFEGYYFNERTRTMLIYALADEKSSLETLFTNL